MRHTFKAYERLKRAQHIDTLFRKGKAYSVFPIKCYFLSTETSSEERSPIRTGFSIPKKNFRKAVHRNRLKRQIKEIWRLNKQSLYPLIPENNQLHLFFIFTGRDQYPFRTLQGSFQKIMEWLASQFKQDA